MLGARCDPGRGNIMTDTSAPGNPTPPQDPNGEKAPAPAMRVLGQYVKDLSFENPGHSPVQAQPNIDLGIDVGAKPHADGAVRRQGDVHYRTRLCWPVPDAERRPGPAGAHAADRMPALALPVCSPDHCRDHARRRIPAPADRPCRLCRAVPGPGSPRCRCACPDPAIGLRPVSRDSRDQVSR